MSNTWTLADALRLSHPKNLDPAVAEFILHGAVYKDAPAVLHTFESLQAAQSEAEVVSLLANDKNASWEMIPTGFLKSAKVWEQLFVNGLPQTALLRNTKRVHNLGMFNDLNFAAAWGKALADRQAIQRSRVHPIAYLKAYVAYKGDTNLTGYSWYDSNRRLPEAVDSPNSKIVKALETGYFAAFKNIVPAEKRTMVALDVSGSMSNPASGLDISCATLGATFCQVIAKTEPYSVFKGFAGGLVNLGITEDDSLQTVMRKAQDNNFGTTDCALPMQWALKQGIEIDTFIVFTDSETWSGRQHPHEALQQYRREMSIPAKLVVVAAVGTEYTIADPNDSGMLDVSGFDSSAPKLIADFSAGRL